MKDSERVKNEALKYYVKHKELKSQHKTPNYFAELMLAMGRILDSQSLILKRLEDLEDDRQNSTRG